jgi:predicted dehydrogenase
MESKDVDAVFIATPNHWHSLCAIWAIEAAKDVYVEKPVSHNVWEGRQLVDAARRYQRIVQAGTQSRFSSDVAEAIQWMR